MQTWEIAANEFINTCAFKDDIEAVFLTGSHASGNHDAYSDIDLYILLRDDVDYRERGNKRINGYLIEYFANPLRQIERYIEQSHKDIRPIEIRMVLSGKVIYDINKRAQQLIDYCTAQQQVPYPDMSAFARQNGLYFLWDHFDELSRAFSKHSGDVPMQYFHFIHSAFELYSQYIKAPTTNRSKLYQWFTDKVYFDNYGLPEYADSYFKDLMIKAIECNDFKAQQKIAQTIYDYVHTKMGGIDIDHFELRGPVAP